jgi:hypothetical protein
MLRVDYERWGQTPAELRYMALNATHTRTRERMLALHDIAQGACATQVTERTGHRPQTVMDWLHNYNQHGPQALSYWRTGGRPPLPADQSRTWRGNPCRRAGSSHTRSWGRSKTALDTAASGRVRARAVRSPLLPRDYSPPLLRVLSRPATVEPVVAEGQEVAWTH